MKGIILGNESLQSNTQREYLSNLDLKDQSVKTHESKENEHLHCSYCNPLKLKNQCFQKFSKYFLFSKLLFILLCLSVLFGLPDGTSGVAKADNRPQASYIIRGCCIRKQYENIRYKRCPGKYGYVLYLFIVIVYLNILERYQDKLSAFVRSG